MTCRKRCDALNFLLGHCAVSWASTFQRSDQYHVWQYRVWCDYQSCEAARYVLGAWQGKDETKRLSLLRKPITAKNLLRQARMKEDLTLKSDNQVVGRCEGWKSLSRTNSSCHWVLHKRLWKPPTVQLHRYTLSGGWTARQHLPTWMTYPEDVFSLRACSVVVFRMSGRATSPSWTRSCKNWSSKPDPIAR
jgi:hypothetical protein